MPTLATVSRFVSIAVFSCLLITGGMWVYHNRSATDGGGTANKEPGNWFTRRAGVDASKLKEHPMGFDFGDNSTAFKTDFQFDPDWFQKVHGPPVEFDWDR